MKLAVVGTGYVGLVSGACFASLGHEVTCIDKDAGKIGNLQRGIMPFHESGLDELVTANVKAGCLRFTGELAEGIRGAGAIFLAVGTPSRIEDGVADLSFVFAAIDALADCLEHDCVIVSKSTVPVGTGDEIEARIARRRPDLAVDVVSCPEFLREGTAIGDFLRPHRVVIGTDSDSAAETMRRIYAPLIEAGFPFLVMTRRSAELAKYAANAFLATKLSFINEMADFAESVSADIEEVALAMGLDPRIGSSYLRAGPGYGGSCFPKDTMALHRTGEEVRASLRIIETVIAANDQRKRNIANRIIEACGGSVAGKRIAILGVAFKPGTDDLRDAPSIGIVRRLLDRGAAIAAFDPALPGGAPGHPAFAGIEWADGVGSAAAGADAAVIVTDWDEFRAIDLDGLARRMATPVLVDLRNMFDPAAAARAGLRYVSIGRSPVPAQDATATDKPAASRPTLVRDEIPRGRRARAS